MLDTGKERLSAFGTRHSAKSHLVVTKNVKLQGIGYKVQSLG